MFSSISAAYNGFLFCFDLCFEQWKTKVTLLASTNISGGFSDGLSFGGTQKNAHLSHF
jgi:hypothetical protein